MNLFVMNSTKFLILAILVILVLIVAAIIVINKRAKVLPKSEISRILLKNSPVKVWVIVLSLIYTLGLFVGYYGASKRASSTQISLFYEQASSSKNSNGTRYNMSECLSNEVLNLAIAKGALKNVTAAQLRACLTMAPVVEGNAFDPDDYHVSTEFLLSFQANKDTKHLDSDNVVTLIAEAYRDYYIAHYADNFIVLYSLIDPTEYEEKVRNKDYLDIIAFQDAEVESLVTYMTTMSKKSSSFISSSGDSFYSIAASCQTLQNMQIQGNLTSYIIDKGLSKDKDSYLGRLRYDNTLLEYDRKKALASYTVRTNAVSRYDDTMARVALVPSYDSDGSYYMNRTKVGVDTLSTEAQQRSAKAASLSEKMKNNETIIASFEEKNGGTSSALELNLDSAQSSIQTLARKALNACQEYSASQMNKCISYTVSTTSPLSCAITALILGVFTFFALHFLVSACNLPSVGTAKKRQEVFE